MLSHARMRRLLTLLLMITLTVVSGSSVAAAMCSHQNAQAHAAALHGSGLRGAAVAQMEEAAGKLASKKGALADAGSFSLPAFIMPDGAVPVPLAPTDLTRPRPADAAKIASLSIPPLLEPPAA